MPYQSEIEKLEQRFREKPEQWFAALADAYRKAGEVERALDVVRAGLEKRPNYTSGHIVLGRCLLDQLNDPEAAEAFERVLQLDAENIIALKSLSEIAERQGDVGAACRWLERLLEVDPMNDEARAALEALEADREGAAEEPAYEASRWAEPERSPASVEAAGTVEVEERRVPISEAPTGPTRAVDIGDADVEEPVEEEDLELETSELAARISDEFPVPDLDLEGPAAPAAPPATEPTVERPALEELEVERAAEPEGEVPAIELEPLSVEHASEGDRAPTEFGTGPREPLADLEPAEPIWAQDALDVAEEPLDVTPFDEELAWDAGERLSQQITQEDLEEAEKAHEESIEATARYLPGLEHAEVPDIAALELEKGERTEEPGRDEAEPSEPVEAGVDGEQLLEAEPAFDEVVSGEFVEESFQADEFEVPTLDLVEPGRPPLEEALEAVPPEEGEARGWEPEVPRPAAEAAPLRDEVEEAVSDVSLEPAPEETAAELPGEEAISAPRVPATPQEPSEETVVAGPPLSTDLPLIMPDEIGEEDREKEEPEPEPVLTETMAEVYARQGLFGEARHIYEQILARRPGDAELERRIAELDARVTSGRPEVRGKWTDRFAAAVTGGQSLRDMLAEIVSAGPGFGMASGLPDDVAAQASAGRRPTAPPDELPLESTLGAAFEEAEEPSGVSSSPDAAGVSLASVFGEDPEPGSPRPPAPPPSAQRPSPTAPSPYDEFFAGGSRAPQPDTEPPAKEPPPEGEEGDQDFRDWLQGLKS